MIQSGSCLSFAAKTSECLRIAGYFFGQKLKSEEAMQTGVFGFVDDRKSYVGSER